MKIITEVALLDIYESRTKIPQALFLVSEASSETCNFVKKDTLAQLLSCKFCKNFKSTILAKHLRATDSALSFDWNTKEDFEFKLVSWKIRGKSILCTMPLNKPLLEPANDCLGINTCSWSGDYSEMTSPRRWIFSDPLPTLVTASHYFYLPFPSLSPLKNWQFFSPKYKLWNRFWYLYDASYHKLTALYMRAATGQQTGLVNKRD